MLAKKYINSLLLMLAMTVSIYASASEPTIEIDVLIEQEELTVQWLNIVDSYGSRINSRMDKLIQEAAACKVIVALYQNGNAKYKRKVEECEGPLAADIRERSENVKQEFEKLKKRYNTLKEQAKGLGAEVTLHDLKMRVLDGRAKKLN